jgi:hypothetical protein
MPADTGVASAYTVTSIKSHQFDKVKQLYTNYPTASRNFTADLRLDTSFTLKGTITVTGTAVAGFGTSFNTELEAGDIISMPSGLGGTQEQRIVLSVTDNLTATLSAAVTNNIVSATAIRLRPSIADQNKDILLRQLAKPYIKTLKTTNNLLQPVTSIEVRREFIVTTDLNEDGSVKTDKEGKEKRSFRAPAEDDWTLIKKKTEFDIERSNKTVGTFIYETLLQNFRFIRIHASCLVNSAHVVSYKAGVTAFLELTDGSLELVSKRRKREFLVFYGNKV